jgi:competence protein ComGC
MKRLCSLHSTLTIALLTLLAVTGCKKEEAAPGNPQKAAAPATASAERTSFAQVTSQLDSGGSLYVYLSTEQWLAGVSGKVGALRGVLGAIPDLASDDRENLNKAFDIVTNLIQKSGIEDVSGIGMSSIARETNFYHTKMFLHHYAGQGSGFLWNMFGQKAHALDGLSLLPTNTALATFSDLDAPMLWSVIQKQVAESGFPQAEAMLNKLPDSFETATGLKWDKVLASLGGEFGFALTLDDTKMIPIPLPGAGDPLQIPEPGLLLVAKVKDDTIFNRIDEALQQSAGQQIIKADKPGLKMRTWPLALPLPIQLRPSVAVAGGYLFIATTDALIQEVLAVKAGQHPGLKSTQEFLRLSKDVPAQGNSFSFVSQRFGQTVMKVQQQALQMTANTSGSQTAWLQSFLGSTKPAISYTVAANTDEGWLTVANGNQHPAKLLAVSAVVPIGILSAIAIPNFVKARGTAQKNACISNLRQIDSAKQMWALENKKTDTDTPTRADLKPYLPKKQFPVCPAGGTYTINPANKAPECSHEGHSLSD